MKHTAKGAKEGGASRRIPRVEKEIREVVGSYLLRGYRGKLPGLVTISRVIASSDLKTAKILVTVMPTKGLKGAAAIEPDDALKKATVEALKAHAHEVQSEVNRQLKMKHCPKLHFFYDEGAEHAMKVQGILAGISKPAPGGDAVDAPGGETISGDDE